MCQHKCGNYWAGGKVGIVCYCCLFAAGSARATYNRSQRISLLSILNGFASARNSTGYLDRIKLIYYAAQNSIKWDDCHLSVCHESQTL